MSDPLPSLDVRLMRAVRARFATALPGSIDPTGALETARAYLAAKTAPLLRDEDPGGITPEGETPKKPRLIFVAIDQGVATRVQTPIRDFRFEFILRANAKTPAGLADGFALLTGALETLLDGLPLGRDATTGRVELLSSDVFQVAVMMARRKPAVGNLVQGDLRVRAYAMDLRAIALEHCV